MSLLRPRPSGSAISLVFAVLSLLANLEKVEAADCPLNSIANPARVLISSNAPARDTTFNDSRASWNLVVGELRVSTYEGSIEVNCKDAYRLEGVPPGTSTSFEARFEVSGDYTSPGEWDGHSLCAPSSWQYSLEDGANLASGSFDFNCYFPNGHADGAAALALVKTPDAPFPLGLRLWTACDRRNGTSVLGRIRFVGLPAGARVVSCQGFTSASITALRRSSWGSLKTGFR